jgi:hypothetical protein
MIVLVSMIYDWDGSCTADVWKVICHYTRSPHIRGVITSLLPRGNGSTCSSVCMCTGGEAVPNTPMYDVGLILVLLLFISLLSWVGQPFCSTCRNRCDSTTLSKLDA